MNLRDIAAAARSRLVTAGIADGEAGRDVNLLARHVLGCSRAEWYAREHHEVPAGFSERFTALIERRARRAPIAYLRGTQEFWSRDFAVSEAVLIPRPETELILEELFAYLPTDAPARRHRLADIGTGSGCLAVSIAAERPAIDIVATDISQPALAVARANAERHGVAGRITFLEAAYLVGTTGLFDFIVSNPPYVTAAEYETLTPEVREYEPESALVAGHDGLRDIREIVDLAPSRLAPGGRMLIEIGCAQADAVAELVAGQPSLTLSHIATDLQCIPRVAVIERKITNNE